MTKYIVHNTGLLLLAQPRAKSVTLAPYMSLSDIAMPKLAEDIGKLDICVGKITECVHHRLNNKLFIETVDVGEQKTRQACSELTDRYTPAQLVGRKVVVLCNANPVEKQGTERDAMLICAVKYNEIELLNPPPSCEVGDFVVVDGFPRQPEPAPFSPKMMALYEKSPFEKVSANMKVNCYGHAVFRDRPLKVEKRPGTVTADTFTDCGIGFE